MELGRDAPGRVPERMALAFRSIVVPVKAIVMNLLSLGAAFGVIVAVFQWAGG